DSLSPHRTFSDPTVSRMWVEMDFQETGSLSQWPDSAFRRRKVNALLSPVYHGERGARTLKELARSYLTVTKDLTRAMNRVKGLYRSWAIPCAGRRVYSPCHRLAWLEKLPEAGVRRRAERLYQQLDDLQPLRQEARKELLGESRKHPASEL